MKKLPLFLTLFFLFAGEVFMSQVHHIPFTTPIEEFIDRLTDQDHILMVKGPLAIEKFKTHTFPKRTHYQRSQETRYEEMVYQYQVVKVIQSDRFKVNDTFWNWGEPAYDFESIKLHHEEGILESPALLTREPEFEFTGDTRLVIAIPIEKSSDQFPVLYRFTLEEGSDAEERVKELLNANKN